ncbi:MAG: hypothetical protein KGJ77_09610, partial [Acidobacteriota bacterium]|nr:hypothetical protein [Acidobacteriota bacterium]
RRDRDGIGQGGTMRLGRLLRAMLRLVLGAGAAAGAAWLVRALLGRAAGEPAVATDGASANGSRRTPLSFDSWPPVPQAPQRPETGEH